MEAEKQDLLKKAPPRALILRLSLPTTFNALLISCYGIADSLFLSRLGNGAGGTVGIVLSVTCLIQTVGFTLGTGAGSLVSRALGAGNTQEATVHASLAFRLALLLGGMILLIGLFFLDPIIRFLGATDGIFPYARSYAFYLFCSAPVLCASFVVTNLLRAEGKAICATVGSSVGNLLNIALDPLLIFRFGMGCAGASLATLISQSVGLLILLSSSLSGKSEISLFSFRDPHPLRNAFRILLAGSPSLFRQGLAGVASVLLTRSAGQWGDAAVAAFSICARVFLLLYAFCLGIGQGLMPAAGYSKGANNAERTTELYRFAVRLASCMMFLLAIPTGIFAPQILSFFRPDADVIAMGTLILRAQCAAMPLHGVIAVTNMHLQAVGRQFPAVLLACARQGIFFLPLIFLLPSTFGLTGLQFTQPTADLLTFLLTLPFAFSIFHMGSPIKKHEKRVR